MIMHGSEEMRALAFLDIETTGLDPSRHEILEVAVLRVEAATLTLLSEASLKVAPERLHDADPESLRVNGYSAAAWRSALPLDEALSAVAPMLHGALLAGHNPGFDKGFLVEGWRRTGLKPPPMDHHLLDTASLAWPLYAAGIIPSISLTPLCQHLGIERPSPHRALADAYAAREVARRLLPSVGLAVRMAALEGDERAITETLLSRLDAGRKAYGPWRTDDGRHYPREALMEVLDALHYVAAELVRFGQAQTERQAHSTEVP